MTSPRPPSCPLHKLELACSPEESEGSGFARPTRAVLLCLLIGPLFCLQVLVTFSFPRHGPFAALPLFRSVLPGAVFIASEPRQSLYYVCVCVSACVRAHAHTACTCTCTHACTRNYFQNTSCFLRQSHSLEPVAHPRG